MAEFIGGSGDGEEWYANLGDRAESERVVRGAIDDAALLSERDRNDPTPRQELGLFEAMLGATLADHDLAGAKAHLERGIAAFAGDKEPDNLPVSFAHCALADVLARIGKPDDARREATLGLDMIRGTEFGDRIRLQVCRRYIAHAYLALGDRSAALAMVDATLDDLRRLAAERPNTVSPLLGTADVLLLRGEIRSGCEDLRRAADVFRAWSGETTPYLVRRRADLEAAANNCH